MQLEFANPIITAKDIILQPFKTDPLPRNLVYTDSNLNINKEQLPYDSYLSTPLFIKRLT